MKKSFKILNLIFLVFLVSSCSSLVDGLNEDPNNPADADAELMMTGLQLANTMVHEGELTRLAGMWSGYFTGSDRQYIGYGEYSVTAGDFDNIWGTLYAETVAQARIVQAKADELNNNEAKGIAQIIEAHAIGTATALWGDVPFTQAADVEAFPEPQYDSQAEVYAGLQTLLDEAIANVGSSSNTGSEATTLGGGTWAEVANTLKARYYLHTGNYAAAATAAAAGISSTANNWMADHTVSAYTDGRFNLIFSFCIWYREGYMTANDAYLPKMLDASTAMYRGDSKTDESGRFGYFYNQLGWYGADYDPHWWVGGMFWRAEPYPLLGYSENQLILAEASMEGGDEAAALAALNAHRAALDATYGAGDGATYGAYDLTDFDDGGIANAGGLTRAEALMAEIHEEKYVSMYGQIEGFTDVRRTNNAVGVPAVTGSAIPERFVYPQAEVNSNSNTPSPLPGIFDATPVNQ